MTDKQQLRTRTREEAIAAIDRAQQLMRKSRRPGESLVEELMAQRRAEAALEDLRELPFNARYSG